MQQGDEGESVDPRTRPFERLVVLGLGLLGGSLAMAARRRGLAKCVVGSARRRAPLEQALAQGIVDEIVLSSDAAGVVAGADLIVLASPVSSMPALLESVAAQLDEGALVTDVGSVKGNLAESLPPLLPPGVSYIGSHPMAGSHLTGVEHAREGLFDGSTCVVTPSAEADETLCQRLEGFWRGLGCRVVARSPESHDAQAAWVSHVPHLLAFAFDRALGEAPAGAGELRGSGFRDFTRIGRSDVRLWGDILSANKDALAAPVQEFRRSLDAILEALEAGDPENLQRILAASRKSLADFEGGTEEAEEARKGAEEVAGTTGSRTRKPHDRK